MKLISKQAAPLFKTTDVFGRGIDLHKLRGNSVYLAFERNAGCPVCNLRTHELLKNAEFFNSRNIRVILIYESSEQKMKEYLGDDQYPFHFVADPNNKLYNLYGVERSFVKLLSGMFNGLMGKAMKGKKLFRKSISQDGHADRIPAEFMIDQHGNLLLAHYGKFVGDHLPIQTLLAVSANEHAIEGSMLQRKAG